MSPCVFFPVGLPLGAGERLRALSGEGPPPTQADRCGFASCFNPFTSCATAGRFLTLSGPQFPQLEKGMANPYLFVSAPRISK